MMLKRSFLALTFLSLLFPFPGWGQFLQKLTYAVETGIDFSGGTYTPFWLVADKYGLSSVIRNNGYWRGGIFLPAEKGNRFSYAFGLDVAVAYRFSSTFVMQQAYADLKYSFLELSIGSKERFAELKNHRLSSGGLTFSGNARPIPQVRVGIPEYWNVPGTKRLLALKGHVAYGVFTDDRWQKDFVANRNKYTEHVLYHSKALYVRAGNEECFPLVFEGGLEMAAQFGGKSYNWHAGKHKYIVTNMPNGVKDFLKVLIPSGGGSAAPLGEQTNIYGNHVGSWNFSLSYRFPAWKFRGYYEHYFDDHSMMFGEYGWKDCLAGAEITFPSNPFISTFVYEYVGTKDQSGPIYHDRTDVIPDQISAMDDYYNHTVYTGWQHWGMGIGNPLAMSPVYNKDGSIQFKSNRLKAHHFGLEGRPLKVLDYRVLVSCSRHWGTYKNPFYEVEKNVSFLIEWGYSPSFLHGWKFTGSFAFDWGDLMGDNTGAMLTIRKTGLLIQ